MLWWFWCSSCCSAGGSGLPAWWVALAAALALLLGLKTATLPGCMDGARIWVGDQTSLDGWGLTLG